MKKAALHNLGCKVNAYETEAMQQLLEKAGYEIVSFHEKLDVEADSKVTFDNVLAVGTDKGLKAGKDCAKATVDATVVKNGKGKKITVFTYKPKKNEKRKMGHRQPYTKVEITKINA